MMDRGCSCWKCGAWCGARHSNESHSEAALAQLRPVMEKLVEAGNGLHDWVKYGHGKGKDWYAEWEEALAEYRKVLHD